MLDMDMMGAMGWWILLVGAVGLAWLTLAVVVIVRLVRGAPGERQIPAGHAEEQLRQRYAAGEIDHDEYVERVTILRNRRRPG